MHAYGAPISWNETPGACGRRDNHLFTDLAEPVTAQVSSSLDHPRIVIPHETTVTDEEALGIMRSPISPVAMNPHYGRTV